MLLDAPDPKLGRPTWGSASRFPQALPDQWQWFLPKRKETALKKPATCQSFKLGIKARDYLLSQKCSQSHSRNMPVGRDLMQMSVGPVSIVKHGIKSWRQETAPSLRDASGAAPGRTRRADDSAAK